MPPSPRTVGKVVLGRRRAESCSLRCARLVRFKSARPHSWRWRLTTFVAVASRSSRTFVGSIRCLILIVAIVFATTSRERLVRGLKPTNCDFSAVKSRNNHYELLWHTGGRIGTARALDLQDFDRENEWLEIIHHPDTGTLSKNGERGERFIALNERVCEILTDWIETNRPNVEDEHGQKPLFASSAGRARKTTLRRTVYRVSQPCFSADCSHDRDPAECDAKGYDGGNRCPSGIDPHTIRRSAIT
ncbi:hypothetical protein BRC83_01025 [Halobacteriales archaeon QS_1_68_17]|nr:MAG: hypothetical protein BRC83_01025 [Halobacteriales archaeon QS_1_68_17]